MSTPNSDFEHLQRQIEQFTASWAAQVQAIVQAQTFGQQLSDLVRPLSSMLNDSVGRALEHALSGIDLTWLEETWERAQPPNWREFESSSVEKILDIMDETGWCLVWCPRGEIIGKLLDAADVDARTKILLESVGLVIEDLRACLAETDRPEINDHRDAAMLAITAFADGHFAAAQALAASDISALINGELGMNFGRAKQTLQGDPREESINAFREQAVLNMVSQSLQSYYAHLGDPAPAAFSRHATVHSISPQQYTESNSLASLLLLVAFVRELDLLLEAQDRK